jgi:hypothetical protein
MNKESITLATCPLCFAEECCNISPINEFHNQYSCMSCGYETNDLMVEGEFDIEAYEAPEDFPLLYKDIKQVDELDRVWYPMTINQKGKGTVYAFGTCKEDWRWRATRSIPLTEEELLLPKYKKQTHKSDPTSTFDFDKDFFAAADYAQIFDYE